MEKPRNKNGDFISQSELVRRKKCGGVLKKWHQARKEQRAMEEALEEPKVSF